MGNTGSSLLDAVTPAWFSRKKYSHSSGSSGVSGQSMDRTSSNHHQRAGDMKSKTSHIEALFEIDTLDVKLHRSLVEGYARDVQTDAVWVTIPRALNGRSSKVLLVDRHQRILTKREHSVLFRELKNHVHLAVYFCQRVQHDAKYAERLAYLPKVQELQHPRILRLYGHFMHNRMLHVLIEHCQQGNLAAVLEFDVRYERARDRRLPIFHTVDSLLDSARQLCLGVSFMHEAKLAHTNLSSNNVFVSDAGDIMIGDFREAVAVEDTTRHKISVPIHHGFAAPERYLTEEGETEVVVDLIKADAWSTGMLIFVMTTRHFLFANGSTARADFDRFRKIGFAAYLTVWKADPSMRANRITYVPSYIHELLEDLLQADPAKRLSVAQAIEKHEWLQGGDHSRHLDTHQWKLSE